ncbi:MAG: hypothetical protein D4S01_05060 [Dehalococcoidia bacterium]|nr:MAG: hypothetical protein D4S01_05060 [Dehalococcoidia bacterium]
MAITYSEQDLRELRNHLKISVAEEKKKETGAAPEEELQSLSALSRLLEAIRYNPLLFKDVAEGQVEGVSFLMCSCEIHDLPLHINDHGYLSKVLVTWRLNRGV